MELHFETPRSARPKLLFLTAVILAVVLWPVLRHVMGIVSPVLGSDSTEGGQQLGFARDVRLKPLPQASSVSEVRRLVEVL